MAGDATRLRDGAEVAFFPPVTGGLGSGSRYVGTGCNAKTSTQARELDGAARCQTHGSGAVASFIGVAREPEREIVLVLADGRWSITRG